MIRDYTCVIQHRSFFAITVFVLVLSLTSLKAVEASPVTAETFDKDDSQSIQYSEITAFCDFLLQRVKQRKLSGNVSTAVEDGITERICKNKLKIVEKKNPKDAVYSVEQANEKFFKQELKPFRFGEYSEEDSDETWITNSPGVMIRRKHESIRIHRSLDNLKVTEGALLSYTRDFENEGNIYQINGTFSYPFIFTKKDSARNFNQLHLSEIAIVPSASYDRIEDETDSSNNTDSIALRLGSEWRVSDFPGLRTQYFWIAPVYNIDSDADTQIIAGELEWRPVIRKIGIGQALRVNDWIRLRWKPRLHGEWGYVLDDGGNSNIRNAKDFARLGPKIDLDVWTGDQLKFYANWQYLEGLTNDSESHQLLETGVEFTPDPNSSNWTINLEYRNGEIPLLLQETETLTLGLGIKF